MATTMGLSVCHTSRGRITVIMIFLVTVAMLMFVYNVKPLITASSRAHLLKISQVRQNSVTLPEEKFLTTRKPPVKCTAMKRYPDTLIVGVRKGGTRALIDMLKCHPNIVAAISEIHYFDRDVNFAKGVQWYINQMPYSTKQQITIEKSPGYFVSPSAPGRVYTLSPKQKLIFIVRNPIDRTVSDYTQLDSKNGKGKWSFEGEVFISPSGEINTAYSPISVSMYDIHFQRWLEYFDLDQILIVDGDKLIKEPTTELKRVEKFLQVKSYFTSDMFYYNSTKGFHCWKKNDRTGKVVPFCLGSAKGRHHPKLSNITEQRLASFFAPHNKRFFEQIKYEFDWGSHKR